MKRGIWILPLILLAGAAAAEIQIFNPPDKLRTFDQIVMMQGKASPAAELKIEGVRFQPQPDGTFACGLVLRPGKNLVVAAQGEEAARLHLLRLVTFPDSERTEANKPHWARGQIAYLATLGIVEGYPDGNFYPDNLVTRGELATWLAKVKKLPATPLTQDVFFDVPKEHWRAPYIKAATEAGVIAPYSRDTFGIDEPVSRAEATALAVRDEGEGILAQIAPLFKGPTQEAITRAEAATLISFFASAKESLRELSDFDQGFTADQYCGLNVPPAIVAFTATPEEVSRKQPTTVKLRATVAARESFAPVSTAKVNLTSIGGASDAELFDDGTHGDETSGDGIYSLNLSLRPKATGEKRLEATVTDRLGWEGKATAALLIVE